MNQAIRRVLIGLAVLFGPLSPRALDLADLSIEDLMKLKIPAMMTLTSQGMIPASVTTITEEDIRLTPARNIYDLLEVYVPGAMWTVHNEGNHLSLRGLSSDRETKILLLVNGFKINQDAYAGAADEIVNWDLNDIKEIQVIRGPGSVTYGPGAIEAVINIVTKDTQGVSGVQTGMQTVSGYRSGGGFFSFRQKGAKFSFYGYGSVVKTLGYTHTTWDVDTSGAYGKYGDANIATGRPPGAWFQDYRNSRPQGKIFLSMDFFKEWKLWARYNGLGWSHEPASVNAKLNATDPDYAFERQILTRYAVVALENQHKFSDKFRVKTELAFHSYDRVKDEATPVVPDRESVRNRNPVFGTNRGVAQVTANMTLSPKFELALGGSYVDEYVGKGWYRDARDMYIYGITSGADSNRPGGKYYVGNGWFTQTMSVFGEANWKLHKRMNVILSSRADKNKYTDTLFSPRLALMSDWGSKGVAKVIWQQAQRMNDLGELYISQFSANKPDPEELRGGEFIWESQEGHPFKVIFSTYLNRISLLGFNQTTLNVTRLGQAEVGGVELEIRRVVGRFTGGLNQSFTGLSKFKLGSDVKIASFSYADAIQVSGGGTLNVTGTGKDINNWANHSTKLFARYKMFKEKVTLHADARVYWAFEGKQNALDMFENAIATQLTPTQRATAQADIDFLRSKGVGDLQWRFDAATEFQVKKGWTVVVTGQNLFGKNMVRYGMDGGANRIYPTRFEFTEEPTVVGAKLVVDI